jgi:hypothetical protein
VRAAYGVAAVSGVGAPPAVEAVPASGGVRREAGAADGTVEAPVPGDGSCGAGPCAVARGGSEAALPVGGTPGAGSAVGSGTSRLRPSASSPWVPLPARPRRRGSGERRAGRSPSSPVITVLVAACRVCVCLAGAEAAGVSLRARAARRASRATSAGRPPPGRLCAPERSAGESAAVSETVAPEAWPPGAGSPRRTDTACRRAARATSPGRAARPAESSCGAGSSPAGGPAGSRCSRASRRARRATSPGRDLPERAGASAAGGAPASGRPSAEPPSPVCSRTPPGCEVSGVSSAAASSGVSGVPFRSAASVRSVARIMPPSAATPGRTARGRSVP